MVMQHLAVWKNCCSPIPQRWLFGLMGFFAHMNAYTMRNCLSIAMTAIVAERNNTSTNVDATCPASNSTSSSTIEPGVYEWDESTQGLILSAFYWGYVVFHIPGGYLADRYGGKHVLSLGILSTSIFTLLTPLVIETGGSSWLIALRAVMGLGEGTTSPGLNMLLAQWSPPSERSKITTLTFTGQQLGNVLANAVSGLLIQYTALGWRSVFYVFGSIGVIWYIAFIILCYNSPEEHPFISDKEKAFILKGIGQHTLGPKKAPPTPWRFILTSGPMWALVFGQYGHDWGLFTMITDLPLYMNNVLKFSIRNNGLLSALPYAAMWISSLILSWLADWLINSNKLSITNTRKMLTTIGSMGPAFFLIGASYAGCDRTLAVSFFVLGMTLMGGYYPGMKTNVLDLSPNYSGTVMGIVNGAGAFSGIISPYLVSVLTPHQELGEWRVVFWIVFGVFTFTNVIYLIFASGDIQPWNDPEFLIQDTERRKNKAAGEAAPKDPIKSAH